MTQKNLIKSTGIVIVITIISKIFGLLRDATIASTFGATLSTDAYTMSMTIPDLLFGVIGAAIATTFIPALSESYKNGGRKDMYEFANSIINLLFIMSIVIFIFGWIYAPSIVHIIAPKFIGEKYNLTVELTRLSVLNILFMSTTAGYISMLHTLNKFTASTLTGFVVSIPIIIYNLLGAKSGIYGLVIVTLIGFGLQIFIQIPCLLKNGYKYRFKININDSRIKKMLTLIIPVLIGTGVNQINTLVDRIMASGLPDGSIVSMDFAIKISTLVYGTFALPIITVIYPTLSIDGTSKDFESFKAHISKAINNINLIMIPSAVGLMILRSTVISVIFKHGAFDNSAVSMTSIPLLYLVFGMVFYGIRDVCNRSFYALKDTKTPMINGILGLCTCIGMNIIMVPIMGIGGLAISNVSAAIVSSTLLIINLRRKLGGINEKEILDSGSRIIVSSIIMGLAIYVVSKSLAYLGTNFKGNSIILICSISIGAGVYFIMLSLLNVKEYKIIVGITKRKIKTIINLG
ncbi:murein biosynthesis integral membrane protein MurJ [Clostridium sp. CS001]|uniref:murein biosynthesis integral membrane protein MurJ n=1 Tax=Clostridium sp. CS001 TaxID=2880648 RepID=UPI001CF2AFEB|nr:murein biosynthesis integral membrane protein MurJ [Clostridium sp. CS001]MCB2289985.1 murein biosynthesis integral membrane protein MurJ [Clostridium sp. CS001]